MTLPLFQCEREGLPVPCLDRLVRMVLICYAQIPLGGYLLQTTKERMLLITSKKKDICKCKGKSS